jgi:acetylornithine/succinyldiaminopimelate/putrescine aminotransferase
MSTLRNDPILGHITTFGGHPISSAAAAATVNELINSGLLDNVEQKGQLLEDLLVVHPKVLGIRRLGLMMAIQFNSFEENKWVIDELIKEGVVSDWFLFCDDSMRIAPPLIITEEEIRMVCEKVIAVLDKL